MMIYSARINLITNRLQSEKLNQFSITEAKLIKILKIHLYCNIVALNRSLTVLIVRTLI